MTVVVVRTTIHSHHVDDMVEVVHEYAPRCGLEVGQTVGVPGVHEIPVVTSELLAKRDIEGVVALGVIVAGASDHDQVLGFNVPKQLVELSCKYGKPVGIGIIGPGTSWEDVERSTERYAKEAVDAVAEVSETLGLL